MRKLLIPIAVLAACSSPADDRNPVAWQLVSAAPQTVSAGATVRLDVKAEVSEGWRIYSLTQGAGGPEKLSFAAAPSPPFTLDQDIQSPPPEKHFDPNFSVQTETHSGGVTFVAPVKVAPDAEPGSHTLELRVRYQACTTNLCLPPRTTVLRKQVAISA